MGTTVAIEARAHSEGAARSALETAFAAVTDVEGRMHPQQGGSDVQRINTASPGERCPIHASTWRVLELARRLHSASDGVFDPCLPQRAGRLDDLELSPFELQGAGWVICRAPVALDLGGIAKGYAVDRATDALIAAGCGAGLVNSGGDLRLFGTEHRTVLLRHAGATYQPLLLENTALAVSDLDAPRRPSGHRGYYVRSANTPPLRRYAAVLAPQAALADALTKCALLCPPERVMRIFREFGAREAG
jgi:thiamine biosynthesis lipoprotein